MKRTLLHIAIVLISYSSTVAASTPRVIYGLLSAATKNLSSQKGGFIIQANNFNQLKNAIKYQHQLQRKTHYPVRVKLRTLNKKKFYTVTIGPISTTNWVKKTAIACLSKPPRVVEHHNQHIDTRTMFSSIPSMDLNSHHQTIILPPKHQDMSIKQQPKPSITTPSELFNGRWFIAAGAGVFAAQVSSPIKVNNGSDFPAPYNTDLYSTQQNNNAAFELSGGYRWQQDRSFLPAYSIGLMWQTTASNNLGQNITQNSDPTFLNYTYEWKTNSNVVFLDAKLNLYDYKKLSPYVRLGLGGAFNQTSHYSETALADVTPRVSPGFQDNNANQFAYHVGAGLDYALMPNVFISFDYNYVNLGQLASGPGTSTWSSQTLNFGSYYGNEFLVHINYLFDNNNVSH